MWCQLPISAAVYAILVGYPATIGDATAQTALDKKLALYFTLMMRDNAPSRDVPTASPLKTNRMASHRLTRSQLRLFGIAETVRNTDGLNLEKGISRPRTSIEIEPADHRGAERMHVRH